MDFEFSLTRGEADDTSVVDKTLTSIESIHGEEKVMIVKEGRRRRCVRQWLVQKKLPWR